MPVTRLLLGDAHRFFVEALAMRLDVEPGLQVVAAVVQPEDAVRVVHAQEVDVAVLAVDRRASGFLAAAAEVHAARPSCALVGVADEDDPGLLLDAVRAGFRGWVLKDVGIGALVGVVAAVRRGETRIPPLLLTGLLQRLLRPEPDRSADELTLTSLTAREAQVLRAMSSGASRQEIADQLGISPNTVRTHMQSILTKLNVHTALAAVTLARRAGVS